MRESRSPAAGESRIPNRALVRFAVKALAVYVVWFVVYDLWLLPDGRLDRLVSLSVADVAGTVLRAVGVDARVSGRVVALHGQPGVIVEDGCNGLAVLGLFVGFVMAYPGTWRRRAWFIPFGLFALYVVNVLRVAALLVIQGEAPQWFGALHTFGATTIFYVAVFGLWLLWIRLGSAAPAEPP